MSGVDAKKSLGQHWLEDDAALEAICDAADVDRNDNVLEIGPGLGALTGKLLERGARVHAVEFDKTLLPILIKSFAKFGQDFRLEQSDILKYDLNKLPKGYKTVANIPYYLTNKLLRTLCEADNPFSLAALLVQKEVAERVAAKPGGMSVLSISVQLYCDVDLGDTVPARLFTPPPKVDSRILILRHLGKPRFEVDTGVFFGLVKAGFAERRKMLRGSLSGGLGISKDEAESLLKKAGIEPSRRAQELSLEDWYSLYKAAK